MTWSYTPSATPSQKDQIRDLVGDIDTTDQLISDEAVNKYLTGGSLAQSNIYLAAAMVASEVANKFARGVQSVSAGGSSVVFDIASARAKFFRDLAASLRLQAARSSTAGPYCGGVSKSAVQAIEDEDDRVQPAFSRSLGDYPGTSPTALASEDWP